MTAPPEVVTELAKAEVAKLDVLPERIWEGAVEVADEAGTVTITMDVVVMTEVT